MCKFENGSMVKRQFDLEKIVTAETGRRGEKLQDAELLERQFYFGICHSDEGGISGIWKLKFFKTEK